MKKILFLIHDLGRGGAEKVLVNLVNHMDHEQFDICVTALFGGGVNEQFLDPHIRFRTVFPCMIPGNSKWMKWLSPSTLHKLCVKGHYDVEASYLEGPSARVISGCSDPDTKLVCWIHSLFTTKKGASWSFKNEEEAESCYQRFDRIVCVSETVKKAFENTFALRRPALVLYNTIDSMRILQLAQMEPDSIADGELDRSLIAVGTPKPVKAFDRLVRIVARLRGEGVSANLIFLGDGPDREKLEQMVRELHLQNAVSFLGYQGNPYQFLARSALFVCSSLSEGFSTAATEALIVGTPVCTTEVSGMREMLGDNEYGLITDNDENALYQGIKRMLTEPGLLQHYREKARERGRSFSTEHTVQAVERFLKTL